MNILEMVFLEVLNLSLSGSIVILGILLLRLLLGRTPRKYSYFLWIFAGIRLICPVVLPVFSGWFPVRQDAFVYENLAYKTPHIQTGLLRLDSHVSAFLQEYVSPTPANSVNPMQIYIALAAVIWVIVLVGLLFYQIVKYISWKRKLSTAVRTAEGDIYETDRVGSPVLFGIWKPAIYVPLGMDAQDRQYAVAHEQIHKKRRDYLIKLLAYGILLIHWFNPLCWLAFYCMVLDMEMSCDEAVLKNLDGEGRVNYGKALLNESLKKSGFSTLHALSFGSGGTKKRLKNVLRYKKRTVIITVICVLVILLAGFFFLSGNNGKNSSLGIIGGADGPTTVFIGKTDGFISRLFGGGQESHSVTTVTFYSDGWFQALCESRHLYVGDASANGKVLGYAGQSLPDYFEWAGQELQTTEEPYEIRANYTGVNFAEISEQDLISANLRHSAIVFATIENADIASLGLTDANGEERIIAHTRQQIEELLGRTNLYEASEDIESMKEYMNLVSECLAELSAE